MSKLNYQFILNGVDVAPFVEWQTSEVLATFDNEANQANITIDKINFVNENYNTILSLIQNRGVFEGVPFKIQVYDDTNNLICFDGMLDLTDDLTIDSFNGKIGLKLRKRDDLLSLDEKVQALSFGYLESIGVFSNADYTDVKYIVQKKFNIMESIMLALMAYMLTKEIVEGTKTLAADISNITAHTAGGISGPIAGIAYSIAIAIIDAIYLVFITIALVKVATKLIDQLIPIRRNAKTLNYKTALTKIASHLGYTFESNIADLDAVYYLPSNFYQDLTNAEGIISDFIGTQKGIPYISDYGYNVSDFFALVQKQFNGKWAIIGNKLVFYNADDMFWNKATQWIIPSRRDKVKRINANECVANRYYKFDYDLSDEWTISQYKGTSYEVITDLITTQDKTMKLLKGFDEVAFGVCLAHRKDTMSGIEKLLLQVAQQIDSFTGSKFADKIKASTGIMIISNNNYVKPKSIKLGSGNRLVDRSEWSAGYIYNNYYKGSSFVNTINNKPFYAQKSIYNDVRVGFNLSDFVQLVNNSLIKDEDGNDGKAVEIVWNFYGDAAKINYFIREPFETKNLKEIFIEPDNIKI